MDYENNNTTTEYISSPITELNKLGNFSFALDTDILFRMKNPMQSYIDEVLPEKIKDENKRRRIAEIMLTYSSDKGVDLKKIENKAKSIIERIKLGYDFSSLKSKDYRILLRYDDFWVSNTDRGIRISFMSYVKNLKDITRIHKHVLLLYIRKYSSLKNDKTFMDFIKVIHSKYIGINPHIPIYINNILKDCDILNNPDKKIVIACLNERKIRRQNILDIIKEKYRYIRPLTDLYNEILNNLGNICRDNINNEYYFNLLFNEVLCAEISARQSAELVNKVIKIFDKNKNASDVDLEKVKIALLHNKSYGDPRLTKTKSNWILVEQIDKERKTNAYQIFISWLAQADLEFFFNLIFENTEDPHGRKDFWQKYIKSRSLIESRVILGKTIANSSKVKSEEEKNGGNRYPRFLSEEISCFILNFGKICVVEFSDVGNAVYFYKEKDIPQEVINKKSTYGCSVDRFKLTNIAKQYSNQSKPEERQNSVLIKHNAKQQRKSNYYSYYSNNNKSWDELAEEVLSSNGVYQGG